VIVFYNLSSYDGHFMLQLFCKEYTEYTTRKGTKAYGDVRIIPLNGERNMLLKIGNIVLVDSSFSQPPDNVVKALRKSGVQKFANTIRHFGSDDAYFEKGCYPYEYMKDELKLDETELPPKSAFYNRLVGKELDDEQYERAKQLWMKRGMTMLCDWHHFYLQLDVLLLADVFEAFRHTMINDDLAMVKNFRAKAVPSKSIAIGCTILKFAKLFIYESSSVTSRAMTSSASSA